MTKYVVVTGGEPMLFADVADLCRRLRAAGRHVTIETAAGAATETRSGTGCVRAGDDGTRTAS
jgi:organic radical activating enzyme